MRVDFRHPRWQRLARRLAVPVLLLAALAVGTVATGWRAGNVLKRNQDWVAEHGTRSNAIGAPDLFRELLEANVARFDLGQFRIELPPPDCADRLRIAAADSRCTGARDDLIRLSQRLYQTAAGQAIRDEVTRWNEAFDVVAIRDDRGYGQPCSGQLDETATRLSTFILPKGCRPTQWSAFLGMTSLDRDESGRIDISHRVAADPAPHVFGFLAADRVAELGDWLAIDAQRLAGGAVELETQIARAGPATKGGPRVTAPRALRIDVVGDVRAVTIGTTRYAVADIPTDRQIRTGRASRGAGQPAGAPITREQLCLDAGRLRTPRCTPALLRNGSPYATRLVIPAATRAAAPRIVVETAPVRSISGRLRQALSGTFCGVRAPGADDGTSGTPPAPAPGLVSVGTAPGCAPREGLGIGLRQRITDSLVFWCQGPAEGENVRLGRDAQCFIQFDAVERTSQPSEPNLTLKAADGTLLAETVRDPTDGRARVTVRPETIDLGLLPVVGIGDGDFLSLVGQLAGKSRSGTPLDVSLTIDPALQRIVKEEVEQRLVRSAGQRNEVPASGLFDARRRAVIVLIDMDQSPGDILAISSWPSLGRGERLADWDLRALESWNPPDSPLAALGWAQNNFLTVPGSSFKPITALAALQKAIDGDQAVRQAIIGYTSEADLQRGMSLRFADVEYQPAPPHPLTIRNFQGNNRARGNVGQAFVPPSSTGCPAIGGGAQIGLCEALLKSNNVWFARLADMTDIAALNQVRGQRATEINMAQIVRRLYPPTPFPLVGIPDVRLTPGSRAHATPIVLDSIVAPVRRLNPRITLAFNGIGQQVQTTPTSLATIYAGIGTGRIVRPRIVSGPRQPLGELILRNVDEPGQEQWLRYLRAGLKAVVGSPQGTAFSAFRNSPDLHPFLFAKTGTATVQDNDDRRAVASTLGHTVWLAGYYDPRAVGTGARGPSPIGRRFAFACMVTHARGGTGGALCAPAMERVLRRMAGGTPAPVRRAPLR